MTLQERLAAAEAELAAIKKELEAEQVGSLLPNAWPDCCTLIVPNNDYFDALNTMLELRQQPGSEAAKDGVRQYLISFDCDVENRTTTYKIGMISPCFKTEEHTEAAIKSVGADRIQKMFQVLHGVSE
jgi:hypothetical protein